MLPRLILILLQIVFAWFVGKCLAGYVPLTGDLKIFIYALIFGVLVWNAGLIGAEILKDVGRPSSATLAACLIGALVGAAILFIPGLLAAIPLKFNQLFVPLAGAIIGYMVRR